MTRIAATTCLLLAILATSAVAQQTAAQETSPAAKGERLFALHVKPLLTAKCLACHGKDPSKIEGELDLTSRAKMLTGGETSDQVTWFPGYGRGRPARLRADLGDVQPPRRPLSVWFTPKTIATIATGRSHMTQSAPIAMAPAVRTTLIRVSGRKMTQPSFISWS